MAKILLSKLKEALLSVLQIKLIVLIISWTAIVNITITEIAVFAV